MSIIITENSADDEPANDNEEDATNPNEVQNDNVGENEENEASVPLAEIELPINANESEAQDILENPRVDVQPLDTTMLDEIRRRILDCNQLIDDSALSRSAISNERTGGRGVATSVGQADNATNNASSLAPIDIAEEERFILEEDDTSSDSDSNGSEENDEEREEESNGK